MANPDKQKFIYNRKVIQHFGHRKVAGDVGIEHEIEFRGPFPEGRALGGWLMKPDGSLRNGMEFITNGGLAADRVHTAVTRLGEDLQAGGFRIAWSDRCSTHVHVNVQHMTFKELLVFLALAYTFEGAMVRWAGGPARESNLFCMQVTEAMGAARSLLNVYRSGTFGDLGHDNLRYAAINLKAIATYGSVEFRSMRGTTDPDMVKTWTDMLLALRNQTRITKPDQVPQVLSEMGAERLAEQLFGPGHPLQINQEECLESLRVIQAVLYCQDWAPDTDKSEWDGSKPAKKGYVPAPEIIFDDPIEIDDDDDNNPDDEDEDDN